LPEETEDLKETLTNVWQVAKRRRWWILSTFSFVTVAAILLSYILPAEYRSDATILVEQQQVPERYVTPTSTTDLLQVLQPMTQDILSRARLLKIIDDLGLYSSEKKRMGPDELVDFMRKHITIEPLISDTESRKANAFKISYLGSTAHATQDVVSRLTSLFIEENLKTQGQQAAGTTNFLADQLSAARASLEEQEKRLRDFKMEHLGELPEDQQGNVQILSGLQMQMQNTEAALARARQQQVYLESLLAQYRSLAPKTGADLNAQATNQIPTLEKQLSDLRAKRAELAAQYTPEHPDVVNIDHQIAQTKDLLTSLKKNQKAASTDADTEAAAIQITDSDDPAVAQLKSQLKANQVEIANGVAESKQLQARIAEYQRRLNQTPVRQQQLADLQRDYDLSQKNYADLESKRTQSALATSLVQSQQGEQFRIVDPASLPTRPSSPDRRKMGLMGAVLGIALGAAWAMVLEMKETVFHTDKEVSQLFSLPFVMGIPLLRNAIEERRKARTRVLEWTGGSLLVTAVLALEALVLWKG
jgi:polysaccharide chain length determinant protein (PEP-CTERM system associated)